MLQGAVPKNVSFNVQDQRILTVAAPVSVVSVAKTKNKSLGQSIKRQNYGVHPNPSLHNAFLGAGSSQHAAHAKQNRLKLKFAEGIAQQFDSELAKLDANTTS